MSWKAAMRSSHARRGCPSGGVAIYMWRPVRWGTSVPHRHSSAASLWRRASGLPGEPGGSVLLRGQHWFQGQGTQAARAMQVRWSKMTRRPGVRLHPEACAALRPEAETATPNHLGTEYQHKAACPYSLGRRYARNSGEPLGFGPKFGRCASMGAHPLGVQCSSCCLQPALLVIPRANLLGATSQV